MTQLVKLDEESKGPGCYLVSAFWALLGIIIVKKFWPDVIPFSWFEFWKLNIGIWGFLQVAWPFFLWGIVFSGISATIANDREREQDTEAFFLTDVIKSTIAGVFEEISFRWLIFYSAIAGALLSNWLIFGFAGHGFEHWFHYTVQAPLANFVTLGLLTNIFYGNLPWTVGAAMIYSNGKFRGGHTYQGIVGWVNSWFAGMFLFYLMFTYGLIASIIVHFLYDFFIDITVYVVFVIKRMS